MRLLDGADETAGQAVLDVFRITDPLPADEHTAALLKALLDQPEILKASDPTFLIDRLADLIRAGRLHQEAVAVTKLLVDQFGPQIGDMRTRASASAADLAELTMTLHRLPESRLAALDLFEALMRADALRLSNALSDLDRRPL